MNNFLTILASIFLISFLPVTSYILYWYNNIYVFSNKYKENQLIKEYKQYKKQKEWDEYLKALKDQLYG